MPKNSDQQYIIEKSQSEGIEDLIGRLLFRLVGLQDSGNARITALSDEGKARHAEKMRYEHSGVLQGQIIEKVLKDIRQIVNEKEFDLSEVVAGIGQIVEALESGNSAAQEALERLIGQMPEIGSKLAQIAKLLAENKPKEVVFDELLESNEAGFAVLGKLIVKLTEEVKKKNFPTEVSLSKPVEIEKPKWWKDFNFSWEPLEKIFEKFSKRTFKIKADEPIVVDVKGLPKDVARELSKELTRLLPLFAPKAGYNHPFNFDDQGNLKTSGGSTGGASEDTLLDVLTQLQAISANTDELEINAENINLNTDELEAKIQNTNDKLDILYAKQEDLAPVLRNLLLAISNPIHGDKAANALRITVAAGTLPAVTTVTTVTTVTGLTNIDGYQGKLLIINQNIGAWANNVRSRIS